MCPQEDDKVHRKPIRSLNPRNTRPRRHITAAFHQKCNERRTRHKHVDEPDESISGRRAKGRTLDKPDVVYPTVYGHGDQQLQVEPQREEAFSLLVADVVDHRGFVQLGLQLVSQISWNYREQRKRLWALRRQSKGSNSSFCIMGCSQLKPAHCYSVSVLD